jgi:hypothetical protein
MTTQARKISPRAARVWDRLRQWYGTKFVEQFGSTPPNDWCVAIDRADNEAIQRGLDICRAQHPSWPPTLPEFELAIKPPPPAVQERGPTIMDRLESFARRQHRLTLRQEQKRTWLYSGKPWEATSQIVGVLFPADGDIPGYRVMVADMEGLSEVA